MEILENIPLAPLTTLKVGGPARFFVKAETEEHVIEAFGLAAQRRLDVFVLGGGSNILVSDVGFEGLVIQIALKGRVIYFEDQKVARIAVEAGEDWDTFVEFCVSRSLAGVECLSGIPGSVGGTPVQNVGAYGQEVAETIVSVKCFDRHSGKTVELSNSECGFAYRKSIFNSTERGRYIVLEVAFELKKAAGPKIVYKDLKESFPDREPTLAETREAVLEIRRAKSMVIDANDPNSRSAGSFFKNPIVATAEAEKFENAPSFPAGDGWVKIPAAWLIEQAGFQKGYRLGNAGISANHSLALVNFGGAAAAEIVELKNVIQAAIKHKFGIELQPEPIFVGFSEGKNLQ